MRFSPASGGQCSDRPVVQAHRVAAVVAILVGLGRRTQPGRHVRANGGVLAVAILPSLERPTQHNKSHAVGWPVWVAILAGPGRPAQLLHEVAVLVHGDVVAIHAAPEGRRSWLMRSAAARAQPGCDPRWPGRAGAAGFSRARIRPKSPLRSSPASTGRRSWSGT